MRRVPLLALVLAACSASVESLDGPPTAQAGPDRVARVGEIVVLDGGASSDPAGRPLTFRWTLASKPANSSAVLGESSGAVARITPDVEGELVVALVVDNGEQASAPDTVVVSTANVAPIAHAGDDVSATVGAAVTLDGTRSRDPNDDPLTFAWRVASRPEGSMPTLADATRVRPAFTPDVRGVYVIELVVSDGRLSSIPDRVTVRAGTDNVAPIADAGPDFETRTGQIFGVSGVASTDANGDILRYHWRLVSQPASSTQMAFFPDAERDVTYFADVDGEYVLELTVDDRRLTSAPDTVVITASGNPQRAPLQLPARALAFDAARNVIYASVGRADQAQPTDDTVVSIDPISRRVINRMALGAGPGPLTLSPDAQFLYVSLVEDKQVVRRDLTTGQDLRWSVGPGRFPDRGDRTPLDLAIVPGEPGTVAVSTHDLGISPSFAGVVVLDANGARRPQETAFHTGASVLVAGSAPGELFGYNNLHTGFGLYRLQVTAMGVRNVSETGDRISGSDTRIVFDGGWLVATTGQAIETGAMSPLGSYPLPDVGGQRTVAIDDDKVIFVLGGGALGPVMMLAVYDRDSFMPIGREMIPVPLSPGSGAVAPSSLIRWGQSGLAFIVGPAFASESQNETRVVIIESMLVGP